MLLNLIIGLGVALLWGCGDITSSYIVEADTLSTTLCAQCAGLILFATFLLIWWTYSGNQSLLLSFSPATLFQILLFGIFFGGVSAASYLAAYYALMTGPLSVVSPVMSAQGGVTLVGALVFLHEKINGSEFVVLLLLLSGVTAATTAMAPDSQKNQQRFQLMNFLSYAPGICGAFVAMVGFGGLSLGLGAISNAGGIAGACAMILCMRIFSLFFLCIFASMTTSSKRKIPTPARSWVLASLVGCLEITALVVFTIAVALSSTVLAGVLSSTYPMFTLLYGIIFRHERPTITQIGGVVCIVGGLVLLPLSLPFGEDLAFALLMIALPLSGVFLRHAKHNQAKPRYPVPDPLLSEAAAMINVLLSLQQSANTTPQEKKVETKEAV